MYTISEEKDCEMCALGKTVKDVDLKGFRLVDFFIPKQEGQAAHTDVDELALVDLITRGIYVNTWIHTHPRMSAFWSGEDDDTSRRLCGNAEFISAIVIGREFEKKVRIDFQSPVKMMVSISIQVGDRENDRIIEEVRKEFAEKVKKKRFYPVYNKGKYANYGTGGSGGGFGNWWEEDYWNRKLDHIQKGKGNGKKGTVKGSISNKSLINRPPLGCEYDD
jgi:hypothetical protein